MEYLDFDVELTHEAGRDYRVSVRSPAGEASAQMRFPYDEVALELALVKLQNALLRSGGPTRRALTDEETAVYEFGKTLFEALMTGEVRSRYVVSRAKADQEAKGLRVRLHIEAPDLAALPWEYLFDDSEGEKEYLCLSRSTPLVRYLNLPRSRETLTVAPPLRILGMIASPTSPATPKLDVEAEQARLEQALSNLTKRGLVELHWLEGHTWRALQQALWEGRGPWHMLHFIGHGGFNEQGEEGMLALETDEGGLHLLSATQLGRMLRDHRALRLVLLNACEGARSSTRDRFSSVGATLARAGIPAVLAMQYEITDRAAKELTRTFYAALAGGLPVDAALTEARLAINIGISNSLEWGTPVLFLRASEGTLFRLAGAPPTLVVKQPDQTPTPPLATPPAKAVPPKAVQPTRQEQPTSLPQGTPQKTKAQWKEEGNQRLMAHKYEEALVAYERALHLDPNDADAWFNKGLALYGLKRYQEALAAFERALHLDPNDADAWVNKGVTLRDLKRYQEALAAHERALQLDPNAADAWMNKGNALHDLKRYQEALAAHEQAIRRDPKNGMFHNNKGLLLQAMGRADEAEQAFKKARELGYTG